MASIGPHPHSTRGRLLITRGRLLSSPLPHTATSAPRSQRCRTRHKPDPHFERRRPCQHLSPKAVRFRCALSIHGPLGRPRAFPLTSARLLHALFSPPVSRLPFGSASCPERCQSSGRNGDTQASPYAQVHPLDESEEGKKPRAFWRLLSRLHSCFPPVLQLRPLFPFHFP
jgi:hypothetical protein